MASGCRSTAPAAAPWPARARRRSSPTTTGARPSDRSRRPRRSVSASCPAGRPRRPRRCSSTAGWRRGRSTASRASFPIDAALRLIPTTTSTASGPKTTWRLRITAANGAVLRDAPKPASVVVRSAAAGGLLQLWSKPSTYDRYRGALRIIASATTPTVNVADELPLETYLRGVVPAEMPSTWPTQALKAQAIASRSYAARRLRPGVSYYDVDRRHELAGLPRGARREGRRRTRSSARRRASSCAARPARSPTRCSIRPAAARPRTTRTSTCRRPARRWPAP